MRLCMLLYQKYEGIGRIEDQGRKEKGKATRWIPQPIDTSFINSIKSASKYLKELNRRKLIEQCKLNSNLALE